MFRITVLSLLSHRNGIKGHQDLAVRVPVAPGGASSGVREVSLKAGSRIAFCLLLLLSIAPHCLPQAPIITTYAGPPLPTDGAQAATQAFYYLTSVIPDGVGGFYFSDESQNKIYRVSADGTLRLIAGSAMGYSGDGGSATAAQLNFPTGIAVDAVGNLYIADTFNNRIRKVTPTGVISTVAGNGIVGFSGDGLHPCYETGKTGVQSTT